MIFSSFLAAPRAREKRNDDRAIPARSRPVRQAASSPWRWHPVAWCFALVALLLPGTRVQAVETGFDPSANGNINAVIMQPDGKILIGGSFTSLQPNRDRPPFLAQKIARLNPDGTPDESFATAFNGDVMTIALQPDGRILVGGQFTTAQTTANHPPHARNGFVRLERDGAIDTSFDPNPSGAPRSQAQVYAIAFQADGRILIGGGFTSLQPNSTGAPVVRHRIARLHPDGTLDLGFDPRANNIVFAIAAQRDGKIVVGGGFTTFQSGGTGEVVGRQRIARLNTDGTVDSEFNPRANNRVLAVAIEPNDTILIGGDFTTLHPIDEELPTSRPHLARVTPEGRALDGDFNPRPNATVTSIAVQRDGLIVIGGSFTQFLPQDTGSGIGRQYLARLDRRGAVDTSFAPNPNAAVNAVALAADGRIVVGGTFTRFQPEGSSLAILRHRIARVQPSGALDGGFATDVDGSVSAIAVQPDGQLVVGGYFTTFAGVTRSHLVRIRPDASVDASFHPEVNGQVLHLAPLADGKLLVSGNFSAIDGVPRNGFARLNHDGTVDTAFDPQPAGAISAMLLESDGRVLVAGSFTSFSPNDAEDSVSRTYFARLNTDGTLASNEVSFNGAINVLVRQPDGKLLVGGAFTAVAGATRNYLCRLNADLTLDSTFDPNVGGTVRAIALHDDGRITFAGEFTLIQQDDRQDDDDDDDDKKDDDADRRYLARVSSTGALDLSFNPTPDTSPETLVALANGQVLVGGGFTYFKPGATEPAAWRSRLARLNADGTVDGTFELQANDRVTVLVATPSGRVWAGGSFTSLYSAAQGSIAADNHIAPLDATGSVDRTWRLRGPSMPGSRVDAIALLADGRMIVGGDFEKLAGATTNDLARLTADGSPDSRFTPATDGRVRALLVQPSSLNDTYRGNAFAWLNANGSFRTDFSLADASQLNGRINAIAFQPDGAILVGGYFLNRAGTTARELARFFADGRLDTSFNPAPDSTISHLTVQPDGKILVAGAFTNIAGVERSRLARLNPDGSVDATFTPVATNSTIATVLVQPDGKILLGGSFTAFDLNDGENDDDDGDGTTTDDIGRRYLARLNADGSLDTNYRPEPNSRVTALLFRGDGKLIVGGDFASFQPNGATSTTSRSGFAVLNTDGTLDELDLGLSGTVSALALQPDGKLLIGGSFSMVQLDDHEGDDDDGDEDFDDDADRSNLIRLNADLTLDASFRPTPNGTVHALLVQSDGRVILGGAFTTLEPNGASEPTTRNYVARVHVDGSLDTGFNPNANDAVYVLVSRDADSFLIGGAFTELRPEAPLYIAGEFQTLGGVAVANFGRVNVDGNVDTSFLPAPDGAVHALALQRDGAIVAAGAFTRVNGTGRQRLARFRPDGQLDALSLAIDGPVHALAVQDDGAIIVGGEFSRVDGFARARVARITPTGTLDTGFAPAANGAVHAIALESDGSILLGGEFTRVGESDRSRLARVRRDGSLDAGFDPRANGSVSTIAVEADGGIWIGGRFDMVGGLARGRLARLERDGRVDAATVHEADGPVHTVVLTEDGRALLGGEFSLVDGQTRTWIARVDARRSTRQELTVNATRTALTWSRSGALPLLASVSVAVSTDRVFWRSVGQASRNGTASAWTWSGEPLSDRDTLYYVRLRGVLATSVGGTSGVVEHVWQFFNSTSAGVGYPAAALIETAAFQFATQVGAGSLAGAGVASEGAASVGSAVLGDITRAPETPPSGAGEIAKWGALVRLGPGDDRLVAGLRVAGPAPRAVAMRVTSAELSAVEGAERVQSPLLEVGADDGSYRGSKAQASGDLSFEPVLKPGAYTLEVCDRKLQGGDVWLEVAAADVNFTLGARDSAPVLTVEIRGDERVGVALHARRGPGEPVSLRLTRSDGANASAASEATEAGLMWRLWLPAGTYTLAAEPLSGSSLELSAAR